MNYNSGSSHLLSYIIQEATGMSTERFAKKYLFDPLKLTNTSGNKIRRVYM